MICNLKRNKWLVTICTVYFTTVFLLFANPVCAIAAPPGMEYSLATVKYGAWRPQVSAQGRVRAWKEATLRAPFAVVVTSMRVVVGQAVIQGQKLAQLEIPALQRLVSRIRTTQAGKELAEKRVAGAKRRVGEKLATLDEQLQLEESLSRAKSEFDTAWQELENALLPLGQSATRMELQEELQHQPALVVARRLTQLRAPFSGTIARKPVTEGSRVADGAPLLTLADTSRVRVELLIPQSKVVAWREGEASVTLPGSRRLKLRPIAGEPRIDPVTGLAVIQFSADNPGGRLLAEAWVSVMLAGKPRQVLWVPESAVVGRDGKTWCVRRQGKTYAAVEISVGQPVNSRSPVLSGLRAGDRVVTQGAYLLLYRDLKKMMKFED
jgi:RND family efflux transporter MFP subunit